MKKISIISINFNQPALTEDFLSSVATVCTYPNLEIIIVDNGSSTDPCPAWREKYPRIRFIRSEKNLGFAGGNNLAIREAKGEYLFLVNNDTEFSRGLIEKLADVLNQNPEVGIVSPKIRYFDKPDAIQYAGYTAMNYNTGRNKCIGQFEKDRGQYDHSKGPTAYIHGAAMMFRRELTEKADLMNESFFLYYEEMDWCERIKRSGYQIWIEPQALIYHKESISVGHKSALKEYYMTRNRILFIRRNAPALSRIIFFFHFVFLVSPRNILSYIFQGRMDLLKAFRRGAADGIEAFGTTEY